MKPWGFWEPFGKEDLAVKALHSSAETESKVWFFSCNMKRMNNSFSIKKATKERVHKCPSVKFEQIEAVICQECSEKSGSLNLVSFLIHIRS